jgi:hypothetical protein
MFRILGLIRNFSMKFWPWAIPFRFIEKGVSQRDLGFTPRATLRPSHPQLFIHSMQGN